MSDRKLIYIAPDELRRVWIFIKPGLDVIKKNPHCENWIAEDVYAAIKYGKSTLHVGYFDYRYVGFLVLTPLKDVYTNEPILHVWLAYSIEPEMFDFAFEEVEKMAKAINATKITLSSPRRGWERRGFEPAQITYERKL